MKKLYFILLFVFISTANLCAATYYIDYNSGNDSANGTSKSSPWKRAPGMKGFTGPYSHSNGDRFIFKGGVTWPSATLPFVIANSGGSGNPDYYGAEVNWYSGSSFTRPILDGEYANLGGGAEGSVVFISSKNNITIDNIEIKRLNAQSNWGPAMVMVQAGGGIRIQNCYLHDWTTVAATDDAHGAVIGNGNGSLVVTNCTISNTAYKTNGGAIRNASEVSYCKIFDVSNVLLTVSGLVYNNEIYRVYASFDPTYHTNLIYFIQPSGNGYIYNNYIHDIYSVGAFIYPNPCWSGDGSGQIYVYNNVIDAPDIGIPIMNFDPEMGIGANCGSAYVWNNTIYSNAMHSRVSTRAGSYFKVFDVRNNHSITNLSEDNAHCYNNSYAGCGSATTRVYSNNLLQSTSAASSQGYNSSNKFSPTTQNVSTVGKGANLSAFFTIDINGISRIGSWDAGAYQFTSSASPNNIETPPPKGLRIITTP